ncbi:MAG: hypothetical protein U1A77_15960 [Pirellulales bacterium]
MPTAKTRTADPPPHSQTNLLFTKLVWSLTIGICLLPWIAGAPRLVKGLQAWHAGGADSTVEYPPSRYKGNPTGGWSESARSATQAGLGWLAVGVVATTGLVWTYVAQRRRATKVESSDPSSALSDASK